MMVNLLRFPPRLPFRKAEPETTMEWLNKLARDEAKAIEDYAEAAAYARGFADLQTASVFEHIRSEEMHHLTELNERTREILYGKK